MPGSKEYIIGNKYGKLTLLKVYKKEGCSHYFWLCKCDCGNIIEDKGTFIRTGKKTCCNKDMCIGSNLIGRKFGRWTVESWYGYKNYNGRKKRAWYCTCSCGNNIRKIVPSEVLFRGDSLSCGCLSRENTSKSKLDNLTGKKFSKLLVIERHSNFGPKHIKWKCKCDCGRICYCITTNLKSGNSKSCGKCLSNYKDFRVGKGIKRIQTLQYTKWRKSVFERDNFSCVICGKRGNLNAHHMNSWDIHPKDRYKTENGATLCGGEDGCHTEYHNIYGRGNNSKKQFKEYLNQILL